PITPDHLFGYSEEFSIFGTECLALNAPGHTAGSCLLICDKWDCIFAGDVIFQGSVGRTDGYSGSPSRQRETLKKLRGIEHNYKLFCGHGDITDINTEKRTNPYLSDI
ncbi:MAG: MBL fold metallo-hydrolase, partial [Oscillospiraceae bacterium]|nr:MBL fold metallo-hydrolase [Oscillospiraceae bacterium]